MITDSETTIIDVFKESFILLCTYAKQLLMLKVFLASTVDHAIILIGFIHGGFRHKKILRCGGNYNRYNCDISDL